MKRWRFLPRAGVVLVIGLACCQAREAPASGPYEARAAAEEREARTAAARMEEMKGELSAAQSEVVAGNLDIGWQKLERVRAAATTAGLTARVAFLDKLIEVFRAEKHGDHGQLRAALAEAIHRADGPDEVTACWQVGLAVSQRAVAAKQPHATAFIDLLSKGPVAALGQFEPHLGIARLWIEMGNAGSAEAELRSAARCTPSPCQWSAWIEQAGELAALAGRGRRPRDGPDVFDRLREAAQPATALVDVAKGRFLLAQGRLAEAEAALDRALQAADDGDSKAAVVELNYALATAWRKAGNAERAQQRLDKAEQAAQEVPFSATNSATMGSVRDARRMTPEQAERAAEANWKAAFNTDVPQERERALLGYGPAAVAAGHGVSRILDQLQSMTAGRVVYLAVAEAFLAQGARQAAEEVFNAAPPEAVLTDSKVAEEPPAAMRRIHHARQHGRRRNQ